MTLSPLSPLSALLSLAALLLSDPSYHHRNVSHHVLEALLPLSLPNLEALAQSPDPEVQTRARLILERYHTRWCWQRAMTMRPRGRDQVPWIDMVRFGDLPGVGRYVDHVHWLQKADPRWHERSKTPHWEPHRRATQLWLFEQLCEGWDEGRAQFVLDRMGEEEEIWVRQNEYMIPWQPPWDGVK